MSAQRVRAILAKHNLCIENFPEKYKHNSECEKRAINIIDEFTELYHKYYLDRKPLLLAPYNECGVRKMICTFICPSSLPYDELFDLEQCASYIANYMAYEPLCAPHCYAANSLYSLEDRGYNNENNINNGGNDTYEETNDSFDEAFFCAADGMSEKVEKCPQYVLSPSTSLQCQRGNSLELSLVLASLLIGVGYNAYVVTGYATKQVCLNDQSDRSWNNVLPYEAKVENNNNDEDNDDDDDDDWEHSIRIKCSDKCKAHNVMVSTKQGNTNTATNTGGNINVKSKDELTALVDEYKSLIPPDLKLRRSSAPAPSSTVVNNNTLQSNLSGGSNAHTVFEMNGISVHKNNDDDNDDYIIDVNASSHDKEFNKNNKKSDRHNFNDDHDDNADDDNDHSVSDNGNEMKVKPYHCWILILNGGRKSVERNTFIEPSTGEFIDIAEADNFYSEVESVFNHNSYYVNLHHNISVSGLQLCFDDVRHWEIVVPFKCNDGNDDDDGNASRENTLVSHTAVGDKYMRSAVNELNVSMSTTLAKIAGSLSNTIRQPSASPEFDRFSGTGGMSAMSVTRNQTNLITKDGVSATKTKTRIHIPCSWVTPLSLSLSQYESRYPHNHKSIIYGNAIVHFYAPYSQPDLRIQAVILPAAKITGSYNNTYITNNNNTATINNDNNNNKDSTNGNSWNKQALSLYTHIFYAHRADKLRRISICSHHIACEGNGNEVMRVNYENVNKQTLQQQQLLSHPLAQLREDVQVDRVHAWYDAGRVHDTIIMEGLREVIYIPEQRRVMKFYWRARDDGLRRRVELFANGCTLRKVKEFYSGRQDRLCYRSASFAAPQTTEDTFMHKMIVTGNVHELFAHVDSTASFTQLQDAINTELEPYRMSQRFERNYSIDANHDVSKTTFLRTHRNVSNKNTHLTNTSHSDKNNNINNNNNSNNTVHVKNYKVNETKSNIKNNKDSKKHNMTDAAHTDRNNFTNNNYIDNAEEEMDGEMWVYFHHEPHSIIRPSHFFAKPSAGVTAYIAASSVLSEIKIEEPAVQITCMPGEAAPTELELHKERKWLAAMESKCLSAIKATMKETLIILHSLKMNTLLSSTQSFLPVPLHQASDHEAESMSGAQDSMYTSAIPKMQNGERKPASFYTVEPIYSPYDTLRNRLHETEAQKMEKLAALRRQEESRKDYLAPYIAKVIATDKFDGNYLTVSLNAAEATQVRDEALKELKERLIGRGKIMQERMDKEKEMFKARQLSYQQSCESDAIDGSSEALEFARYAQEATWRMKVLEERLAKHIDEASEKYATLAKRLATDERLRILYKGNNEKERNEEHM